MQRHKQPLEFLESPYQGGKRFISPILAARRPYLAPCVKAEELNAKWVSVSGPFMETFKSNKNVVLDLLNDIYLENIETFVT